MVSPPGGRAALVDDSLDGVAWQPYRQRVGTQDADEVTDGGPVSVNERMGHEAGIAPDARRELRREAREQESNDLGVAAAPST